MNKDPDKIAKNLFEECRKNSTCSGNLQSDGVILSYFYDAYHQLYKEDNRYQIATRLLREAFNDPVAVDSYRIEYYKNMYKHKLDPNATCFWKYYPNTGSINYCNQQASQLPDFSWFHNEYESIEKALDDSISKIILKPTIYDELEFFEKSGEYPFNKRKN